VRQAVLVLDASAIINLLATGAPERVLSAFGQASVIEENTLKEIIRNPFDSAPAMPYIDKLVSGGLIRIARMNATSYAHYIDLVGGKPRDALGQGESAAIACALEVQGLVVLDDLKARRISAARFPRVEQTTTVGLFRMAAMNGQISDSEIADLLVLARTNARMHVLDADKNWFETHVMIL